MTLCFGLWTLGSVWFDCLAAFQIRAFRNSQFCYINFKYMHPKFCFTKQHFEFGKHFYQHFEMHSKIIVWIIYFKIKTSISITKLKHLFQFQTTLKYVHFRILVQLKWEHLRMVQNGLQNAYEPNTFKSILKCKFRYKWPNN